MQDNENPFAQDENMQEQVRQHRRDQAERAMGNLQSGTFANIASALYKSQGDPFCVICHNNF